MKTSLKEIRDDFYNRATNGVQNYLSDQKGLAQVGPKMYTIMSCDGTI